MVHQSLLKTSQFPIKDDGMDGHKLFDKDISDNKDDEVENQKNTVEDKDTKDQCYLCPISSCTHSLRDYDKQLERKHFVTSHLTMDNIDNVHFLKL